jgi:hypothetical protein
MPRNKPRPSFVRMGINHAQPIETRVGRHIAPQPNGCWQWTGPLDKGYGQFREFSNGPLALAHRWVYEALRGPLPAGVLLHHTCENKACVNPDHLVQVTRSEHASIHQALRRTAQATSARP